MNVLEAIRARRSVRKYQTRDKIPQEHIDLLLEAAMSAPSACNSRPWEFVVVENAELRKQIPTIHPHCRFLPDATLALVVCGLPDALPTAPGEGFWPQDCAAATQNILLAATELGYGSCWCGVYPDRDRAAALAKMLGVTSVPVSLIAIGVADEVPVRRGHLDTAKVRYLR